MAIGPGDNRGATDFVNRLATPVDLGQDGTVTMDRFSALVFGHAGTDASRASTQLDDAHFSAATLSGADFTAADLRGTYMDPLPRDAVTTNLIALYKALGGGWEPFPQQ